ncbi:Phox homologous domain-containing protein, partial [Pelagophyceae sp. CCMP2097]
VKVTSPQLVGDGLQSFTLYAVRTRTNVAHYSRHEIRVQRRFSDFVWCHDRLRRASPGVVVPPLLSPKRWTNNTSHDFVRDRMESLTRFVNR